jgi:intracellular sulfur oxidation DsrE/DsrF family protein
MRKWFRWAALVVFASLSLTSIALAAKAKANHSSKAVAASGQSPKAVAAKAKAKPATKPHRIAIQVDQNDPAVMNLALNNATNVIDYYRANGVQVKVDLVTYGPGLNMLRDDTSPVKDRIKQLKDYAFPSTVQFSACGNTKENMEKKEGHPITVLSEAVIVPSGVVHLMELQEKGWSYVRP